jgi:hypothetical protein
MRVGREVQRQVLADEIGRKGRRPVEMNEDERRSMAEALMTLPSDRRVAALRSAGLAEEADELERRMAEEHIAEMRRQVLDRINELPEDERLAALVAEGFDDEARELSERLAAAAEAAETVEEPVEEPVKEDRPAKAAAPKKKGGRTRKQTKR